MTSLRRHEFWRWTLACGTAEFVGIAVAAAGILLVRRLVGEPLSPGAKAVTLASAVAGGVVEGAVVGVLQWSVLRRRFGAMSATRWITVTALTGATLWLVGMAAPTLLEQAPGQSGAAMAEPPRLVQVAAGALGGTVAGAVFGTAQWALLRRHAHGSGRWIWANMIGWTAAMAWIFAAASSTPADATVGTAVVLGALGGLLGGLSVGLVTGLALVRIEASADSP